MTPLLARLVLRYVRRFPVDVLVELKRELTAFNATTRLWDSRRRRRPLPAIVAPPPNFSGGGRITRADPVMLWKGPPTPPEGEEDR